MGNQGWEIKEGNGKKENEEIKLFGLLINGTVVCF
jgi:hypothetical protein